MKNSFQLNIKNPCSENFNQFSPTAKGGFCDLCQQEVVDFTKMNSDEIIAYLNNLKAKNLCGRFNSTQLKKYDEPNLIRKKTGFIAGFVVFLFSIFTTQKLQAQETKTTTVPSENSLEIDDSKNNKKITVQGTVKDEFGFMLDDVSVHLQGTSTFTNTDHDGKFKFPEKLKEGDVLVFNTLGLDTKEIKISNPNENKNIHIEVTLREGDYVLLGKVDIKAIYRSE